MKVLNGLKLNPQELRSVSIVRGNGFSSQPQAADEAPLNPYGWHGLYLEDWAEYDFSDGLTRRHFLLPRLGLLAPARVCAEGTFNETETRKIRSGILAVLEQRPDGFWHEVRRIMKVQRED